MAEIYYKGADASYTKVTAADVGAAGAEQLDQKVSLTLPKTAIPNGAALRNYTDVGEYYVPSDGVMPSIGDRPIGVNEPFKMWVTELDGGYVQQTIMGYSNAGLFTRKVSKTSPTDVTPWSASTPYSGFPLDVAEGGTGGTYEYEACQNLRAASLDLCMSTSRVPASHNLDDYRTPGSYAVIAGEEPSNCPKLERDGALYVVFLNNSITLQFILTHRDNQAEILSRTGTTKPPAAEVIWSKWDSYLRGVVDIAHGGTGATTSADAAKNLHTAYLDAGPYIIPEDGDLNNCFGAGSWSCFSDDIAATVQNCPTTRGFKVFGNYVAGGWMQILLTVDNEENPEIWARISYLGSISPWVNLTDKVSLSLGTEIPENANLDEYLTPSIYQCSYNSVAQTIANSPYPSAFKLLVHELVEGYVQQVAVSYSGGTVYMRTYEEPAKSWSRWFCTVDDDALDKKPSLDVPKNTIPGGADLDEYKTVGSYCQPFASNVWAMVNKPDDLDDSFLMYVMTPAIDHFVMQVIIQQTGQSMYMRYFNGDERKWYPWTKYWTSDDISGTTDLLHSMFPTNGVAKYIPSFLDDWAAGGFLSIEQLRSNMGLGSTTGALPVANGGTGSDVPWDAVRNLKARSLYRGVSGFLDAGTDLNDVTEIGEYCCPDNNHTVVNAPTGYGFRLAVVEMGSPNIMQLVESQGDGRMSVRIKNADGWTQWHDYAFKDEISGGAVSLYPGPEIPQSADLNTYKTVGEYSCSYNSVVMTLVNKPEACNAAFKLTVEEMVQGGYITQTIESFFQTTRFRRRYVPEEDVWNEWTVDDYADHVRLSPGREITEGEDLNTFIEIGEYSCSFTRVVSTILNKPEKCTTAFKLTVSKLINNDKQGAEYITQKIEVVGRARYFSRTYVREDSAWTDWRAIYSESMVIPIKDGGTGAVDALGAAQNLSALYLDTGMPIADGTDLNTITQAGTYHCTTDAAAKGLVNSATADAFKLIVGRFGPEGWVNQVTLDKKSRLFMRYYRPDQDKWESWTRIRDAGYVYQVYEGGTGAQTEQEAAKNLKVSSLLAGTALTSGTDLNAVMEPGEYQWPTDDANGNIINSPTGYGFKLQVFEPTSSGTVVQLLTSQADGRMAVREHNADGWCQWREFAFKSDIASGGGTGEGGSGGTADIGIVPVASGGTGATTAQEAAQNLYAAYLGVGAAIAEGTDLNTMKFPGTYAAPSDALCDTLANTPTGSAFKLLVMQPGHPGWVIQLLVNEDQRIFMRNYNPDKDSWATWGRIYLAGHVYQIWEGGTGGETVEQARTNLGISISNDYATATDDQLLTKAAVRNMIAAAMAGQTV